jgi:hypothetical protein
MKTEKKIKKGKPRGRQGGRKRKLVGGRGVELYLDDITIEEFDRLGEGDKSLGARRAAAIASGRDPE